VLLSKNFMPCFCFAVGGNSGSPVLDADVRARARARASICEALETHEIFAQGRFVAINFDRQRLGLMNEFKWSR
jgi:hypothetical protein